MPANVNPVVWFEIPVHDLQRAKAFYETALAISLAPPIQVKENTLSFFPMQQGAAGAGGALIDCPHASPSQQGIAIYFHVESIEPVLARIEKGGGNICLPRTDIGEYGFIAHFIDTEGNRVALHEMAAG